MPSFHSFNKLIIKSKNIKKNIKKNIFFEFLKMLNHALYIFLFLLFMQI
jgi:hypothetical protein